MVFFKSCVVVVFLIELILLKESFELSKIICPGWKIRPEPTHNTLQIRVYFYQTSLPTCHPSRKGEQLHQQIFVHNGRGANI